MGRRQNCGDPKCQHCKGKDPAEFNRNWKEALRRARLWVNGQIDPESIAGTPVPKYSIDYDGDDQYELFDDDDEPKQMPKVYVWSGTVKASYTGMNQIERVTKAAVDVVASDTAGAEQIVRNLYDSILKGSYPKLELIAVVRERDYVPSRDKDLTPKLTEPRSKNGWGGMFGMYNGVPYIKYKP
jgi:hypothetical protein